MNILTASPRWKVAPVMDIISHIVGAVLDAFGRPGSRWAWVCLIGCAVLIGVACTMLLSR